MALKHFPIGVQDFEKIRVLGMYYVDKTDLVYKLTHSDLYYFLSRPRRFGKSLLLSTLKCYFEGRRELFDGLRIASLETEWRCHPVILISFAGSKYDTIEALRVVLDRTLAQFESLFGIENKCGQEWGPRLRDVIEAAYASSGEQPVVLIDEYDAPLLDSMQRPEVAQLIKDDLRKFFSPLKDIGGQLRFLFITGISKFSQLSIFSEVNNLKVITMNRDYEALCGVTKDELFGTMQPEIKALADANGMEFSEACAALQRKYDGYHFGRGMVDIFNPFSLMNALNDRELNDYWFSTGTPTLLTEMISQFRMDVAELDAGLDASLDMFDMPTERADSPVPILYQSGYLTIAGYSDGIYTLAFPNEEVRTGFLRELLPYYAKRNAENSAMLIRLQRHLKSMDVDAALSELKAFFSSIPYDAERNDENHFKTIFYIVFRLLTQYVVGTEVRSAAGRADVVVETAKAVFVFEFKMDSSATIEDALRQIDEKGYLIPYSVSQDEAGLPKRLFKVAVLFDTKLRTLSDWKIVEC